MSTAPQPWPLGMKILFQVVAFFVIVHQLLLTTNSPTGPKNYWHSVVLPEPEERINDFFQEYASARNWHTGVPIYEHHGTTIPLHLGLAVAPEDIFFPHNAHPPTSVLLVLPLGLVRLPQALLLWHLVSAVLFGLSSWLLGRELALFRGRKWLWWLLPGASLLICSEPVLQQMGQAQLNGVLLFLLVTAWVAERRGYLAVAGICLGVATCVKVFPAFLFLYFLLRKQYRTIVAGVLTVLVVTAFTALVLGVTAFSDYLTTVLPTLGKFRPSRYNHSVVGFWHRLFVPNAYDHTTPFVHSPALAWAGTFATAAGLVGLVVWAIRQARTRAALDRVFWLTVTAMVLLGPLTWGHGHLLLAGAVVLFLQDLFIAGRPTLGSSLLLVVLVGTECFPLHNVFRAYLPPLGAATPMGPWHSLLVCSVPFYVLLIFFGWQLVLLRRYHLHGPSAV